MNVWCVYAKLAYSSELRAELSGTLRPYARDEHYYEHCRFRHTRDKTRCCQLQLTPLSCHFQVQLARAWRRRMLHLLQSYSAQCDLMLVPINKTNYTCSPPHAMPSFQT